MTMFVSSEATVLHSCIVHKVVFDPSKHQPGCLSSLVAQSAEGWQREPFPMSVTFHVNLIHLLKHDEDKLPFWLPLNNIHAGHARTHTDTLAHAHTHLENSNFPGAEVCGIKPEPLIRKLHYSPSALWSIKDIPHSTNGVYHSTESAMGPGEHKGVSGSMLYQLQAPFISRFYTDCAPLVLQWHKVTKWTFKSKYYTVFIAESQHGRRCTHLSASP